MPPVPPRIETRTLRRRELLEWLGKGTALALGASLLEACGVGAGVPGTPPPGLEPESPTGVGGWAGEPGRLPGPPQRTGKPADGEEPRGDFPFAPGSRAHEVFSNWGERTVDRQDLSEILSSWQLLVDGLVDHPVLLSFADVIQLARFDTVVDFHCVEGWSIHDVPWNGVHLSTLFDLVQPRASATHVTFHTVNGQYNGSLPLEVAREPNTLLAYGVGGETLPLSHGFPLRVVVPRMFAYKSSKFIARIELADAPVLNYWETVGYPYEAEVPEARLRDGRY